MSTEAELVPLCVPRSPGEEAVLRSLLRAEGIFFSVFNNYFGSLKVGPVIPLYNEKTILVPATEIDRCRELIAAPEPGDLPHEQAAPSGLDKLRMFLEVVLFSWIVPGARRRRR